MEKRSPNLSSPLFKMDPSCLWKKLKKIIILILSAVKKYHYSTHGGTLEIQIQMRVIKAKILKWKNCLWRENYIASGVSGCLWWGRGWGRGLACVAGVWKGRERGFWARGKREGRVRREGRRETPARKPLFSPSRLLIMYAKITQLWMTSCQLSLAAMHFNILVIFRVLFSFVFLKQEIWSEGTIKKRINAVVCWRKIVATMRGL